MTSKELLDFLLKRANERTAPQSGFSLTNPRFMLTRRVGGRNMPLELAIAFDGIYGSPFNIAFTSNDYDLYAKMFIRADDERFKAWEESVTRQMTINASSQAYVGFDKIDVPGFVMRRIAATIIEALKEKHMSIVLFSRGYSTIYTLIDSKETYDEIKIEHDLSSFMTW